MRLAELGEISKESMEEYMANQKKIREARGPAARPTPPPASMPFDPGEKVGQYPRTAAQYQGDLDRIRSDRAKYEADRAAHEAANPTPTPKAKPKFKLPKYTKRGAGAVAGVGALTTGAAAMHQKRQRDATG